MVRRDDFLVGPREKLAEAIKAGKAEEALGYLNTIYAMAQALHEGYVNGYSLMHARLAEAYGEEWLEGFTRSRIFESYRPIFERNKNFSPEQWVQYWVDRARGHNTECHVEEDDDKYAIVMTGCNNGGRLMKDGITKRQNALTRKAYPWCFNKVGVPYYCIHAHFFNELWKELGIKLEIQWGRQYDEQGNKIDDPCKYIIYK